MRRRSIRRLGSIVLPVVAAVVLAGCGNGTSEDPGTAEEAPDGERSDEQAVADPNDDVEDGIYRGDGVVLPVPEGWSLDRAAFAQGIVAAISDDGAQQLTAQAVDTEAAEAAGRQPLELDALLAAVRDQVGQQPDVDAAVELHGAERAHRLTYVQLPAQQDGAPESSATIVLAVDGDGLVGEFVFASTMEAYDEASEALLLTEAGFDPDSSPRALPLPS